MKPLFFFRWPIQFTEANATQKTAVSVSTSTITTGLKAKRFQPFFYLERDL
ncbi:MAG: hypothetical protein AAFR51_15370 [Pseudomonadota bacterium]